MTTTRPNQDFFIQPDPEVEKEKKSVQEMIEKAKLKQKKAKELEKEKHRLRIQHVGAIADETGILNLDDAVLRGAFLYIATKMNDIDQLTKWKESGQLNLGKGETHNV